MPNNTDTWRLAVHEPLELCTDESWAFDSNVVLVLVQRNDKLPDQLKEIDGFGLDRWSSLNRFIQDRAKQIKPSPFTVRIESNNTQFFPLFSFSVDTNVVEFLSDHQLRPGDCP